MIELQPLPMKEAQQFWRDKVPMSPGAFRQLSDEAKVRAFAVSGIAKGDELTTVMQAIQKSLDSGMSYNDFKKDCSGIMERRGYSDTGVNYQLDNIFRTNIQTAYSVGRYKQMQDVKKTRPYWQYSAVHDKRTRPTHAALSGKVFPADHPFWDKWYPPNGFRCRCSVVTLSRYNVRDERLTVETDDPTGKLIEPRDPVTGNKMPARLLMPDPGFAHNPGKSAWGGVVDAATSTDTKMSPLDNLKTASSYGRRLLKNVRPAEIPDLDESILLPKGKGNDFYKEEFIKRYGEEKVVKDVIGEPVILSLRAFLKDKTPGAPEAWKFSKGGHGESIPLMEDILCEPFEVWLTPQKDAAGKIRLTKKYIAFWKTADKKRIGGLGVYEVVDGVFVGVTNFIPLSKGVPSLDYVERQRRGLLLYKKGT